jgi:hypothetical protein
MGFLKKINIIKCKVCSQKASCSRMIMMMMMIYWLGLTYISLDVAGNARFLSVHISSIPNDYSFRILILLFENFLFLSSCLQPIEPTCTPLLLLPPKLISPFFPWFSYLHFFIYEGH